MTTPDGETAEAEETVDRMENVGEHGLELARHATRGAVHAGNDLGEQAGRVARAAAAGTIRALGQMPVQTLDAMHGVGYGIVQGALESGNDPAEAAAAAVEAAREVAPEVGMSEQEATTAAAAGILDAATASGDEALAAVLRAIPEGLADAAERARSE